MIGFFCNNLVISNFVRIFVLSIMSDLGPLRTGGLSNVWRNQGQVVFFKKNQTTCQVDNFQI